MRADGAQLTIVALGGVIGALLRWSIDLEFAGPPGTFPVATLLINVLGCMALGVVTELTSRGKVTARGKLFLGTGVLGGFTTFSAYAVQTAMLSGAGDVAALSIAVAYLLITPLICVVAAGIGMGATRRLTNVES